MLTFCWMQMHIPYQQEVLAFIFIFQKVFLWPPSLKWHHKQTKIMFQITKFNLSDRIYPLQCTYIRIEDIPWPKQILRAVKVRAIWWDKEPCSLYQKQRPHKCFYHVRFFNGTPNCRFEVFCIKYTNDNNAKTFFENWREPCLPQLSQFQTKLNTLIIHCASDFPLTMLHKLIEYVIIRN